MWNSLVVIALTLLSLFVARQAMVYTLEYETKDLLEGEIVELELATKQFHPDMRLVEEEFSRKILSHSRNEWFAGLFDDTGKLIWKSELFPDSFESDQATLNPSDQPHAANEKFAFRQADNAIACWHSFQLDSGDVFTIVLGEPTDFIGRDLWSLTKVLLWIGLAVVVIAPVGGYLLARSSLLPVQEIVETTRKLEPSRLEARLPIRGSGDELDQISGEINSFLDLNARYLNSQREFIANAAHELRSPLTAIQTSAEVCLAKPRTADDYREQLETVSEQCQFLRHLVNQLLELAESDARLKVNKVDFDFSDLVQKSVSIFEGVAEEKGIQLSINVPVAISCSGDPQKLIQVLNNLLDNAIKFSPPEGTVSVNLSSRDHEIDFRISNEGPGVDSLLLERIFDRFYQTDPARTHEQTGNGLGLSISKAIIELHEGRIRAESSGNLLEVSFQLPKSKI
ncbi:Sensor kinase CusS [Mariniblastus fucicola]|uniref:histidine kinase n=1 Tax=Mariniblastus fucicola TaxID=980251 RepID=A0A5B9P863_9BACT|nr:Sensor kinase CusS [Mariniblastus fucicola]